MKNLNALIAINFLLRKKLHIIMNALNVTLILKKIQTAFLGQLKLIYMI